MLKFFFEGILLGLVLAVTLGPAFFTIIQTSIDKGFKSALQFAVGVSSSDISVICAVYFGLSDFFQFGQSKIYAGIIGGVILIMFGLYTFFTKPDIIKRRTSSTKKSSERFSNLSNRFFQKANAKNKPDIIIPETPYSKGRTIQRNNKFFTYFSKGFFLNLLNPLVLIYWMGTVAYVTNSAPYDKVDQYALAFFTGVICTVFSTDILKSYIGNKIKKLLRPRIQLIINRIVGVILMGFGIALFINVFFY